METWPERILFYVSFLLLVFLPCSASRQIKVGGLYPGNIPEGKEFAAVLQIAAEIINNDYNLTSSFKIDLVLADTTGDDRTASKAACELVSSGVVGVVGPAYSSEAAVVALEYSSLHLPLISYSATDPSLQSYRYFSRVVSSDLRQSDVIRDVLRQFDWVKVAVLAVDTSYGRSIVSSLVKSVDVIVARYFDPHETNFTRDVKAIRDTRARIIVLVSLPSVSNDNIFAAADQIGLLEIGYQWIATDGLAVSSVPQLNSSKLDGILGIRPKEADPQKYWYQLLLRAWIQKGFPGEPRAYSLYVFDALLAFSYALKETLPEISTVPNVQCLGNTTFSTGPALLDAISHLDFFGATGQVVMDPQSRDSRSQMYDVFNVQEGKLVSVGSWEPLRLLNINVSAIIWPRNSPVPPLDEDDFANRTMKIVVGLSRPWLMEDTSKNGSDRFSGIVVDLWAGLMKNYTQLRGRPIAYELYNLPNGNEFVRRIAEVSNGNADVALGSFSITSVRQGVVDMSQPFMDTGLIIITKKRVSTDAKWWDFLNPFSQTMWIAVIVALLVFAHFFWLHDAIGRYRLEEMIPTYPLRILEWSLHSLYILLGETPKFPTALSARIVIAGVKIFSTIVLASYTASLAAALTTVRLAQTINSFQDLANKRVAVNKGGSTEVYVTNSGVPLLKVPIANVSSGLQMVMDGLVDALVHEQAEIQYEFNQLSCDLEIAGSLFSERGYGLVFTKGSSLLDFASEYVLRMKESGEMRTLVASWYESSHEGSCYETSSDVDARLDIYAFYGLMLVTALFVGVGVMIEIFSWLMKRSEIGQKMQTYLVHGSHEGARRHHLQKIRNTGQSLNVSDLSIGDRQRKDDGYCLSGLLSDGLSSATDLNIESSQGPGSRSLRHLNRTKSNVEVEVPMTSSHNMMSSSLNMVTSSPNTMTSSVTMSSSQMSSSPNSTNLSVNEIDLIAP
mmetsp:Transcript_38677/g.62626  ORF Transcript_38677/g.62626 Transcript_38677/m.62626 type:complete len:955 (-) Transcript_38677:192-3056(-)